MRGLGVLDGERVQAELRLDLAQQFGRGFVKADPDQMPGAARPIAGILDIHVRDAPTVRVGRGHDDARLCRREFGRCR